MRNLLTAALRNLLTAALLVTVAASLFSQPALAQRFDKVHRCDEFAAHPDDPGRWAEGVHDDDIIPGPAIKFCGDAAAAYPDTPRFHFQYGRALWAGKQYEEAVAAFLRAEEADYGPAYAYMGDAYLHGIGGIETDEAFARNRYAMAAEAGFSPAETVLADLAALEPTNSGGAVAAPRSSQATASPAPAAAAPHADQEGAKPDLLQIVKRWQGTRTLPAEDRLNPKLFARGQRLKTLYEGDFKALEREPPNHLFFYFMELNEYFSREINWHDESCSVAFDPDLGPGVLGGFMASWLDPQNLEQNAITVLELMEDLTQNPGGVFGKVAQVEAERNAATSDGVTLAREYGCESPVFERLYGNMARLLRGQPPAAASGWPGVQVECMKHAQSRGSPPRQAQEYCGCMVEKFAQANVPVAVGEWLQSDYDHSEKFSAVVANYQGLRKQLGACLL